MDAHVWHDPPFHPSGFPPSGPGVQGMRVRDESAGSQRVLERTVHERATIRPARWCAGSSKPRPDRIPRHGGHLSVRDPTQHIFSVESRQHQLRQLGSQRNNNKEQRHQRTTRDSNIARCRLRELQFSVINTPQRRRRQLLIRLNEHE